MKNLANHNYDRNLIVNPSIMNHSYGAGRYRVIYKCRAGFIASSDYNAESAYEVFRRMDMKHVQSIEYVYPDSENRIGHSSMVYARRGKKVWIAEELLVELKVGDINQNLSDSALYSQAQYRAVGANSWASYAYQMNESNLVNA